MQSKYQKFYVEWWHIQKSTIYTLIVVLVFGATILGGGWWAKRNNWFAPPDQIDAPKDAARIVSFEGEVRITRAATRETILVTKVTYVAAGDTVQTQVDGRAIIQMIDGSLYKLGPNSTVVVAGTTSLFGRKDVRVRLNDGQLNVRTDEQPEDTKNIVEVAETENRLLPKTDASFNADPSVNGGEIRISRGGVETTLGGRKTTIGVNEFASVDGNKLSSREKLLAPPIPVSPENSSQLVDATGNGVNVAFSWQDSDGNSASSYSLQVAKSPSFGPDSIMVDRDGVPSRDFRMTGLSPGTYYWRLKSIAKSGQTTNWNEYWKFVVIKRGSSVAINVTEWKVEGVGGGLYFISGRTLSGMVVRAQGREAFAGADGLFKLQISSPSVETAVEIGDDRGNRSGFILSLRTGKVIRRY